MIEALFFDFDGTLRQNLPHGGEVFAKEAARLGLPVGETDRLRAIRWEHYYWASSKELAEDRLAYGGQVGGFWEGYARRQLVALGASREQAEELAPRMNAYMEEAYRPESIVPDEAAGVLTSLKARGLKLAVVSNRSKPYQEELDALGLGPFFAFSLASGEVEAWKPQPEIFWHACQRLDVQPAAAAYVGDNYFADVVGSRAAGLTPVLYDPRQVFPDAGCATIRSFDEIPRVVDLGNRAPPAAA